MEITYTKQGDYLLPDLELEDKEIFNIGKYGLLKLDYLKKNNVVSYREIIKKLNLRK